MEGQEDNEEEEEEEDVNAPGPSTRVPKVNGEKDFDVGAFCFLLSFIVALDLISLNTTLQVSQMVNQGNLLGLQQEI